MDPIVPSVLKQREKKHKGELDGFATNTCKLRSLYKEWIHILHC